MTETKEQTVQNAKQHEAISIETAKVIQGISQVFSGAVTMLEALHPHVSLAPSAILDLVTGNMEGISAIATEKRATEKAGSSTAGREDTADDAEKTDTGDVDAPLPDAVPAALSGNDGAPAEVKEAEPAVEEKTAAPSVTADDITRIIVRKIKQNRSNNEKIGAILKTYGAAKVSDLPPSKFEAFVTDISAI